MKTAERVDAKAGFCQWCRQGSHALCASAPCACTQVAHAGRPRPGRNGQAAPQPAPAKVKASRAKPAAAVWELVREDPPPPVKPKPRKVTPAERVQPFLEAIVEEGSTDWHRVGVFGTASSSIAAASRYRGVLAKEFPGEWEWKSARDRASRPAVYVRRRAAEKGR